MRKRQCPCCQKAIKKGRPALIGKSLQELLYREGRASNTAKIIITVCGNWYCKRKVEEGIWYTVPAFPVVPGEYS